MSLFQIKICGINTLSAATAVFEAGADAIGLNFFNQSVRYVSPCDARDICNELSSRISKVGLFVNASVTEIIAILQAVPLDYIQLHGDETPEYLAKLVTQIQASNTLVKPQVIRAFRFQDESLDHVVAYLEACKNLCTMPAAVLIDAYSDSGFGGTGEVLNWSKLAEEKSRLGELPLILAGGLTPENVAEAIHTARPEGVDVASGVESSRGVKESLLVRAFTMNATAAFKNIMNQLS